MGILKNIFKKAPTDEKTDQAVSIAPSLGSTKIVPKAKVAPPVVAPESRRKVAVTKKTDNDIFKIISKPLITEKATDLTALNKYCFIVPVSVNKSEVIKAVINLYGVKPIRINFIKRRGRKVRYGHSSGETKTVKKAIVTLAADDKIELYEGV